MPYDAAGNRMRVRQAVMPGACPGAMPARKIQEFSLTAGWLIDYRVRGGVLMHPINIAKAKAMNSGTDKD